MTIQVSRSNRNHAHEIGQFSQNSASCNDGEADTKTPHVSYNDSNDFMSKELD